MKHTWKKWTNVTRKISNIQANIVLFFLYFILIVPFGIFLRTFFASLLLGHRNKQKKNSYWIPYPKTTYDLSFAQKQ